MIARFTGLILPYVTPPDAGKNDEVFAELMQFLDFLIVTCYDRCS